MIYSYYKIKIIGKDPKSFIKRLYKMHIEIINIYNKEDNYYILIDDINYKKISNLKTSYNLLVIKRYGKNNIIFKFNYYKYLILSSIFSLLIILLLSNIIFRIEVITDNKEIKTLIINELKKENIKPYKLKVNVDKRRQIVNKILKNNKDTLEWLELKSSGSKYIIELQERLINKKDEDESYQNIVASKNGIIMNIDAKIGEVKKEINDYVRKGDIIISGDIYKKEDIMGKVKASGRVMAEVWYKAKVELPKNYTKTKLTNNNQVLLKINFINKSVGILNKYKNYKDKDIYTIKNNLLPLSISVTKRTEEKILLNNLDEKQLEKQALIITDKKIKGKINKNDYIISKKILKKMTTSSIMSIEVFYKVCEDITSASTKEPIIEPKEE